jgi:hypothetical protein
MITNITANVDNRLRVLETTTFKIAYYAEVDVWLEIQEI